jgi:hypothetical protein
MPRAGRILVALFAASLTIFCGTVPWTYAQETSGQGTNKGPSNEKAQKTFK